MWLGYGLLYVQPSGGCIYIDPQDVTSSRRIGLIRALLRFASLVFIFSMHIRDHVPAEPIAPDFDCAFTGLGLLISSRHHVSLTPPRSQTR